MESTINILHVISSAEIGGGERHLYDLIKFSNKRFMHTTILPYNGPFKELLNKAGYEFLIIDMQKKFSLRSFLQLKKIIKNTSFDVVHSHGYRANFYVRIACMYSNQKNITTTHVSLYDYLDTPKLKKWIYIFLEKLLAYKTNKFICISKAMQADTIKLGVDKNKLVLIPNGIDLERFKLQKGNQKKQALCLNGSGPIIGTVGRMVTEKGQVYLIETLKNLKRDWHDIKCLFVGDGPRLELLKQRAVTFGISDCCVFTGAVTDIEEIYPLLDIFILPSLREPFGLVLLEAMACGVPIIATDTGGPSDFIRDNINGCLVPAMNSDVLSNKIDFLLKNSQIAAKIGKKGRDTVKKFYDVRNTVKKIERTYLDLINGSVA